MPKLATEAATPRSPKHKTGFLPIPASLESVPLQSNSNYVPDERTNSITEPSPKEDGQESRGREEGFDDAGVVANPPNIIADFEVLQKLFQVAMSSSSIWIKGPEGVDIPVK